MYTHAYSHNTRITAAGPVYCIAVYAYTSVYKSLATRVITSSSLIKYVTMRICVTCASDSVEIDRIYRYCQDNGLLMHTGAYIYADEAYWIWRIEAEPSPALTWLLLLYPDELRVY